MKFRGQIRQIAGNCRRRGGSGCGSVRGMGPRHASGGLGRTPNPGLAVCAGKRTRASRVQAPGVRALCLRSTASQAPERTAASSWAGPRSGVYGVSRHRIHPAIPRMARCRCCCRPAAGTTAGAGRSPAETPYLNRPFCVKSQTSFKLAGSAAAVRFPPGPPATRVRPVRPPPLRRRSSRIPACASCRLHPILAARFTGTLRVSRSV